MKQSLSIFFLTATLLAVGGDAQAAKSAMTVGRLTCEGMASPLGLDNTRPHLSWILTSEVNGDRQTAYELQVGSDSAAVSRGKADVWRSGRVRSAESVMVAYGGPALRPRQRCWWRVRAWDARGRATKWSPVAQFSIGITRTEDFGGRFIGLSGDSLEAQSPLLRKTFSSRKGDVVFAHVASLGYHEVYVNGRRVGSEVLQPVVSQLDKRCLAVTYDLSPLLVDGDNEIVLWLGSGWYKPRTYGTRHDGPLVRVEVDRQEGRDWHPIVVTDATWQGTTSGYLDLGSWRPGHFAGERVDGRLCPGPSLPALLGARTWRKVDVVDVPGLLITPQMCPGDRVADRVKPVSITRDGESWLIDMGRVLTGWFSLDMPETVAGDTVKMAYYDYQVPDGTLTFQGEGDLYVAAGGGGERFCNKFNYHAFRYVRVSGLKRQPQADEAVGLQITGGYEPISSFACSDRNMNAIHDLMAYTMRCLTMNGKMVDCPHIERMGYGGDGNSSTMGVQTAFQMAPTYYNWLQAWGDAQLPDGDLPYVAPVPYCTGGGPYWCTFVAKAPWATWVNYGDDRMLLRLYDNMKRWARFAENHFKDGLLSRWADTERHNWFLGDWLAPNGTDYAGEETSMLVANCSMSEFYQRMSLIARKLGHEADARDFDARHRQLNARIHAAFYHPDSHTYATGSQVDMCYPMLVGVVPDSLYAAVKRQMVELTRSRYDGHLSTGLVGVAIVNDWAIRDGAAQFVYDMLGKRDFPGYLYMLDEGATAVWEYWGDKRTDGSSKRSHVHNCYNGLFPWFYQALGGIRPDMQGSGYRHMTIAPQAPDGISWAEASHLTSYGTVSTRWERTAEGLRLRLHVPVGATAEVMPPDGLHHVKLNNGKSTTVLEGPIVLDSGDYELTFSR